MSLFYFLIFAISVSFADGQPTQAELRSAFEFELSNNNSEEQLMSDIYSKLVDIEVDLRIARLDELGPSIYMIASEAGAIEQSTYNLNILAKRLEIQEQNLIQEQENLMYEQEKYIKKNRERGFLKGAMFIGGVSTMGFGIYNSIYNSKEKSEMNIVLFASGATQMVFSIAI